MATATVAAGFRANRTGSGGPPCPPGGGGVVDRRAGTPSDREGGSDGPESRPIRIHYDALVPEEKLNILLIGGGGREHALAWRLAASERCGTLYTTHPENPGLASLAKPMGFRFNTKEAYRIQQFCKAQDVGLVVVGPEDPLAAGLVDNLESGDGSGPAVFGPIKDAARLEADKAWAKGLMRSASIPMAEGRSFREYEAAPEQAPGISLPPRPDISFPGVGAVRSGEAVGNVADEGKEVPAQEAAVEKGAPENSDG